MDAVTTLLRACRMAAQGSRQLLEVSEELAAELLNKRLVQAALACLFPTALLPLGVPEVIEVVQETLGRELLPLTAVEPNAATERAPFDVEGHRAVYPGPNHDAMSVRTKPGPLVLDRGRRRGLAGPGFHDRLVLPVLDEAARQPQTSTQ